LLPPAASHAPVLPHSADSHHLLNVHVDSKELPRTATHDATKMAIHHVASQGTTPHPSSTPTPSTTPTSSTILAPSLISSTSSTPADAISSTFLPSSSIPLQDASAATHADEDDVRWEAEQERVAERDLTAAMGSVETTSPPSAEELLREWNAARETRRAARMKERERYKKEVETEKERKRLLSMSALERQFGQQKVQKKHEPVNSPDQHAKETHSEQSVAASPAIATTPTPPFPYPSSSSAAPHGLFECRTKTVGYIHGSRLIGELSALSSSSTDPLSTGHTLASVTVTTKEPTRVLRWETTALQRLFFTQPTLALGWHALVNTDLVLRLRQQRALSEQYSYKTLLYGVVSGGSVSEDQKLLCAEYRERHGISADYHRQALTALGWSSTDWDRGSKNAGWLDRIWIKKDTTIETEPA